MYADYLQQGGRWLESAKDLYAQVDFNTDSLFNEPAPEYYVAFIIGGVSQDEKN